METAPGVPPPATPVPAGRPFSAGEVIGRSFSVWFGNFAPFSIVTLIVNLPVFAIVALAPVEERSWMDALANLVSAFANLVVTGALTFGVLQTLNGAPVPLGTLLKKGFAKVGSVLLVSFGYGLIVFLGILLLLVPGDPERGADPGGDREDVEEQEQRVERRHGGTLRRRGRGATPR